MLISRSHSFRALLVLLTVVWAVGGIVAPAHAAQEEIHHALQHDDLDGVTTASDVEDEGAVHPEHAAHCHAGACHFHTLTCAAIDQSDIGSKTLRLSAPHIDIRKQADPLGLFRPPRV